MLGFNSRAKIVKMFHWGWQDNYPNIQHYVFFEQVHRFWMLPYEDHGGTQLVNQHTHDCLPKGWVMSLLYDCSLTTTFHCYATNDAPFNISSITSFHEYISLLHLFKAECSWLLPKWSYKQWHIPDICCDVFHRCHGSLKPRTCWITNSFTTLTQMLVGPRMFLQKICILFFRVDNWYLHEGCKMLTRFLSYQTNITTCKRFCNRRYHLQITCKHSDAWQDTHPASKDTIWCCNVLFKLQLCTYKNRGRPNRIDSPLLLVHATLIDAALWKKTPTWKCSSQAQSAYFCGSPMPAQHK